MKMENSSMISMTHMPGEHGGAAGEMAWCILSRCTQFMAAACSPAAGPPHLICSESSLWIARQHLAHQLLGRGGHPSPRRGLQVERT